MKRTFATLATILAVAGTTSFVVAEGNTERPVVAADSQSDRGDEDHTRASRSETRQPIVSELEQMAIDKRTNQKAIEEKRLQERIAAEKRAREKKAREAATREANRKAALAAAAEKARKQREVNSKPRVYKPKVTQPTQNHVAPGGIAACIRRHESGGNYRALNSSSGASGAYQFLDSTWQAVTGLPGKAMNYSPAQQDAAFWKLWNNGRGANQWVTSGMCGY
ncbi:hydrolase [Streptomyces phage Patelgo]|nr:hydrolase [Streptomyces phage Patelgo]